MEGKQSRYLLFCGDYYYPSGGAGDYVGAFDSLSAAIHDGENAIDDGSHEWYNILDLQENVVIERSEEQSKI